MSSSSAPPTPDPAALALGQLVELAHRTALALDDGPQIVGVVPVDHSVDIDLWRVPPEVPHPAETLAGFVADPQRLAIGLTTTARAERLGHGQDIHFTILMARDGRCASVIDVGQDTATSTYEAPHGWVPDALARALRRPTPAPQFSLSACVEAVWLDRLAARVLRQPGCLRTWGDVAELHPLVDPGQSLPGPMVAVQSHALDAESSWSRIRHRWCERRPDPDAVHPPGGSAVSEAAWHDDGSFARWTTRDLVPASVLLPAVLDGLPEAVGDELLDALVSVEAPPRSCL